MRLDLPKIAIELWLVAMVAAALIIPFVGFETIAQGGGIIIHYRMLSAVMAVGLVIVGRLALILLDQQRFKTAMALATIMFLLSFLPLYPDVVIPTLAKLLAGTLLLRIAFLSPSVRRFLPAIPMQQGAGYVPLLVSLFIVLAVFLPLFPFADRRILDIATLLLTYIMLGWGLSLVVGFTGLLDLGYVAFYAIGAYVFALLALHFDFSFWASLPITACAAAIIAFIIGAPVLRLRGDYFAIVTLGFAEMTRIILINWQSVTNGPDGLAAIPRPSFFGLAEFTAAPVAGGLPAFHEWLQIPFSPMHRILFLYYLVLVLALAVGWFVTRLQTLPLGRAMEAVRDDDIAAQSLGINRHLVKLAAYTLAASIGGLSGAFFATRQGFISPESFVFLESVIILAIVVLGGTGHRLGVVFATLLLIGLPELFRELEQYRMLAFGAGLVFIMIWRPHGLLAGRAASVQYKPEPS